MGCVWQQAAGSQDRWATASCGCVVDVVGSSKVQGGGGTVQLGAVGSGGLGFAAGSGR